MIVPSAGIIETAIDELKSPDTFKGHDWVLPDQQKELKSAVPDATNDFVAGYTLGLQAARVLLQGMPLAVENKISF